MPSFVGGRGGMWCGGSLWGLPRRRAVQETPYGASRAGTAPRSPVRGDEHCASEREYGARVRVGVLWVAWSGTRVPVG